MFIGIRFLHGIWVHIPAGGRVDAAAKLSVSDKECFPEMKQLPKKNGLSQPKRNK
jgi:hypothetical protein